MPATWGIVRGGSRETLKLYRSVSLCLISVTSPSSTASTTDTKAIRRGILARRLARRSTTTSGTHLEGCTACRLAVVYLLFLDVFAKMEPSSVCLGHAIEESIVDLYTSAGPGLLYELFSRRK